MRKILLFPGLLLYACVNAQWSPDPSINNPICNYTSHQMDEQMVADGSGGAFVTWRDGRNISTQMDIYVQHISSTGALLWNPDGVAICNATNDQFAPRIILDGSGGAIIVWFDNRTGNYDIYAQRIDANGNVQWTTDGVAVCTATGNQNAQQIMSDGNGGAFIVWCDGRTSGPSADIYAQRINSSGVPQWTADGVIVSNAFSLQNIPQLVTDGNGGFIVSWEDWRNFSQTDIYAQRVASNGFYSWNFNGNPICTETNGAQYNSKIISDGSGGAIICWQDKRTSSSDDIYAQKINNSGTVQWANNGVMVCNAAGLQLSEQMISDGSGGAIMVWEDRRVGRDIYAQRLHTSGVAQWTANGMMVCDDLSIQTEPQIVPASGGASIITWSDYRGSSPGDVYVQKLNSSGATQWTANGLPVSNATNDQAVPAIVSDGNDGALIAWRDLRNAADYDIYGSRVFSDGTLPVHWLEFTATKERETVKLQWKTIDEQNNAGFDIERSADALQWTKIGFVAAHAPSPSVQQYSWTDLSPLSGKSFYRLKQVDLDGRFDYSNTLSVTFNIKNSIKVFPNPSADFIVIKNISPAETRSVQFIHADGKIVATCAPNSAMQFDVSSFPAGMYFIRIITTGQPILSLSFIKN